MDSNHSTPEELEELARTLLSTNKPITCGVSPFILGALFDTLLCGILLMQCGSYIGSKNKDVLLIKALVAFVIAMNLYGSCLLKFQATLFPNIDNMKQLGYHTLLGLDMGPFCIQLWNIRKSELKPIIPVSFTLAQPQF
ncbi:hypothetical protein AG1IA_07720 [Rhizoctonia solani AG-1 IA]|uniref:Uncharacterized protein n=1 Tax=Thanatephorus cucumeris (strain AG1-IA) TaxID=983506 RepID=L8WPJ9_THACA|nr:hypothetical protein AG1IA_07720 [Rhizoctonia solani AG-1 IA]